MADGGIFMILFIHDSNKLSLWLGICDRDMTFTSQVSASTSFFTMANIHSDAQHVKTLNMCEYINCHSGLNIRRRDLLG